MKGKQQIKLGIFVIIGVVLFIGLIYYMGKENFIFRDAVKVTAVFRDVKGLQVGNNVRFAGINVGTVSDISIVNDSMVEVELSIASEYHKFLKKDSKATIGTEGLMGNTLVNVVPGSKPETIGEGDTIESFKPVSIDDIMKVVKKTGEHAAVLTKNLSEITEKINNGEGALGLLVADSAFAEKIDRTVTNLNQGIDAFENNMEEMSDNLLIRGVFNKKDKGD